MKRILAILVLMICPQALPLPTPPAEARPHLVTVHWKLPTGKYTALNLYRIDSCGNVVYLKALGKMVTSYSDQKVIGGQVLKYKLRSVMNNVESADSNIVTVTVPY